MTVTLSNIAANQTFGTWLTQTNQIIDVISNNALTANSFVDGSTTTGNAALIGRLSSNVLIAVGELRGGTIASPATLNVSSNVMFVNNSIRVYANTTSTNVVIGSNASFLSNVALSKNLSVNGSSTFNNTVVINSTTTFNDAVSVANTLLVVGAATFSNTVSIANIAGNMYVSGDLTVNGTTTFVGTNIANGDNIPFFDDTYTLGNTSQRFIVFSTNTNVSNSLNIGDVGVTVVKTYTFVGTGTQTVDTFSKTVYRSAEYLIQMANATNYQISKLLAVHDDTSGYVTEYGIINNGSSMGLFTGTVNATSGNFELRCAPTSSGIITKIFKTMVTV